MTTIEIVQADLDREDHQRAVLDMVNAYAQDPMGAGRSLPTENLRRLIPGLREHPTTLIFLAFLDDRPIGIAVCFVGFSTFAALPLVNIHDLAVLPGHRGQGIGRRLLAEVERKAREMGCCKLTLEVQENNHRARGVYEAAGFSQAVYEEVAGGALFLSKRL
jgi:ribosomal protein S18 acetylase RimI-like enzyme